MEGIYDGRGGAEGMDGDEGVPASSGTRPEAAFSALGNEHRMAIIESAWDRRSLAPTGTDEPIPFSELFEASDLADKGQFNYHLGKLVGPFLSKSADGYVLTYAGKNVARAVRAGSVTDAPGVEDVPVEGRACPYCGEADIRMDYADGVVLFSCTACEGMAPEDPMAPPGAIQAGSIPASALVDRDPAELYDTGIQWGIHVYSTLADGYCPVCAGVVDDELVLCSDHDASTGACESCGDRFAARARYECTVCGTVEWGPIFMVTSYTEPLFGFFYRNGINPMRPSLADLAITRDIEERVVSVSPPVVEYEMVVDGEAIEVRVDGSLDVTRLGDDVEGAGAEA